MYMSQVEKATWSLKYIILNGYKYIYESIIIRTKI